MPWVGVFFTWSSAATRKPSVPCDHGTARNSCAQKPRVRDFKGTAFSSERQRAGAEVQKEWAQRGNIGGQRGSQMGFCALFGPLPPCWRRSRPSRHSPSRARSSGSSPARTARGLAVTPASVTVFAASSKCEGGWGWSPGTFRSAGRRTRRRSRRSGRPPSNHPAPTAPKKSTPAQRLAEAFL